MSIVIAVDGTAASGKGTLAKKLAKHFSFAHLDSGKLYRCVALEVLMAGGDPEREDDAKAGVESFHRNAHDFGNPAFLNDARLVRPDVGAAASKVSAFPPVRAALLDFQRGFARRPPGGALGAVLDGRDIGTVIAPDATAKLFVDARLEVRARRRWRELEAIGIARDENEVLMDLARRDLADKARTISPMVPAKDADLLETSNLDIDAAFRAALALVEPKVRAALAARPRG